MDHISATRLFESLSDQPQLRDQYAHEPTEYWITLSARFLLQAIETEKAILSKPAAWPMWSAAQRQEYIDRTGFMEGQYAGDGQQKEALLRIERLRAPLWKRIAGALAILSRAPTNEIEPIAASFGLDLDTVALSEANRGFWPLDREAQWHAAVAFHHWHVLPVFHCTKHLSRFPFRAPKWRIDWPLDLDTLLSSFVQRNDGFVHCDEGSYTTVYDTLLALGLDPFITSILMEPNINRTRPARLRDDSEDALSRDLVCGGITIRHPVESATDDAFLEYTLNQASEEGNQALMDLLSRPGQRRGPKRRREEVKERQRRGPSDHQMSILAEQPDERRESNRQASSTHRVKVRGKSLYVNALSKIQRQLALVHLRARQREQGLEPRPRR